jgi:hypothetical protein
LLVKKESLLDHPGAGRILDPAWADLNILKKWKDECISSHGPNCQNPMKIWRKKPAWLIDVENKCVVPGETCEGVSAALSYRWRKEVDFRMYAADMPKFQHRNSPESPEITPRLPPIIRHGMHLTSRIGERYLWVDILCISHGDREATAE